MVISWLRLYAESGVWVLLTIPHAWELKVEPHQGATYVDQYQYQLSV